MESEREHARVPEIEPPARDPVTLIGRRGDAVDSAVEFLEGNAVPVRWIDLDGDPLLAMRRATGAHQVGPDFAGRRGHVQTAIAGRGSGWSGCGES